MAEYTDTSEMTALLGADVVVARIEQAIAASAGVIEDACGNRRGPRRFDLDGSASARRYRVLDHVLSEPGGQLLLVDDIGNLTDLVVEVGDGATWTAVTDYLPEPLDIITTHSWPVTQLRRTGTGTLGDRWFPDLDNWVVNPLARITARWGWPATPEPIKNANRILATRYYKRKDAPWGVAGFGETGLARLQKEDPDVALMIEPYVLGDL